MLRSLPGASLVLASFSFACAELPVDVVFPVGAAGTIRESGVFEPVFGTFDRPVLVFHPESPAPADGKRPLALVLHGGAGRPERFLREGCPEGRVEDAGCLHLRLIAAGFVVAYPSGTAGDYGRTWNAGGGSDGLKCVSGTACRDRVDDIAYFVSLVDQLVETHNVDRARVVAAGFSNGAAMAYRLACETDLLAALVAAGGGNQFAVHGVCPWPRATAVLDVHGTSDPCWAYEGGEEACLERSDGRYVGTEETLALTVTRLGCGAEPVASVLPDRAVDGTETDRLIYDDCRKGARVEHLRVRGGGHTWPGGFRFWPERYVGIVARDFSLSAHAVRFFAAYLRSPLP